MDNCYCNSGNLFANCCKPIISDIRKAKTAEQLMRSRYSAFVIADINFLMTSHYKTTRPVKERKSMLAWTKSVKWISLQIYNTDLGMENDNEGWVKFKASYIEKGQLQEINENSYFVKENDIWYYKSGNHS